MQKNNRTNLRKFYIWIAPSLLNRWAFESPHLDNFSENYAHFKLLFLVINGNGISVIFLNCQKRFLTRAKPRRRDRQVVLASTSAAT
jgi:hypothetical protein